jgi:thioredoxin-related protein
MKKIFLLAALFLSTGIAQTAFSNKINWMTWEQAIEANKKSPKMIFVDLYTGWCGWCKVMDNKTFTDSLVIDYMNRHFYAVKFDAEQRNDVKYNNQVFKYNPTYKAHDLAISLLDGGMSYPSFVVLNGKEQRVKIIKGYIEAPVFLTNLKAIIDSQK